MAVSMDCCKNLPSANSSKVYRNGVRAIESPTNYPLPPNFHSQSLIVVPRSGIKVYIQMHSFLFLNMMIAVLGLRDAFNSKFQALFFPRNIFRETRL